MSLEKTLVDEFIEILGAIRDQTMQPQQYKRLVLLLAKHVEFRRLYILHAQLLTEFWFGAQSEGLPGVGVNTIGDTSLKDRIALTQDDILQKMIERDRDVIGQSNSPIGFNIDLDQTESMADPHSVEETSWEKRARQDEIKWLAEKAFAQYKKEEQQRQEELLYKAYLTRRRRLAVGIGSLAMILVILLFAWLAPKPHEPAAQQPVVQPTVATVTQMSQAQWEPSSEIAPDTELKPGPLYLMQGHAEITFKSQAKVILEAPTKIHLVNENAARLDRGVLTANVPKQAHGFTVNTPSACVTDLGTEFGLVVNEDGVADVHVLTGEVAASVEFDMDGVPQTSRILRKDDAMRFNTHTGTVQSIALERNRFSLSWDDVLYMPRFSPGTVFERTTPVSLGADDFESNDTIYLFLEKVGVTLSQELAVNITTPGTYERFKGRDVTLPAGTVVDSYLIHYNPVNDLGTHKKTSATITFPRSIVGLIVETTKLHASDTILGRVQTHYPGNENGRGLEGATAGVPPSSDQITVTQDRRHLQVAFGANVYDQMRILIASPGKGDDP